MAMTRAPKLRHRDLSRHERGIRSLGGIALLGSLVSIGAILGAQGCATSSSSSQSLLSRSSSSVWELELDRLVMRQARRPDAIALKAPPPPETPADLSAPLSAEAQRRANLPFAEALLAVISEEPASPPAQQFAEPTEQAQLDAIRLYVSGRARRLDGDLAGAEQDFRHAARLDPTSAAIWREYAETQVALGNQPLAASAFRRALAREPNDMRSLEALSQAAMERRDYAGAASLLARMSKLSPNEFDPALPAIISSRMGRALLEMGFLVAGAEALEDALNLPDQFGSATNYIPELTQVYRQRGDLWREIGDGALRRGDFENAADAYRTSATLPSLDPAATTARRVLAAMRLGQSAGAAGLVLSEAADAEGRIDDRRLDLLRYIATHSSISREMARAITGLGSSLSPEAQRLAAGPLARAAASVLPEAEARALLRERVAAAPGDEATLRDLLARADAISPLAAVVETSALIDAAPLQEPRYTRALIVQVGDAATLLDQWIAIPSGQSATLGSRLLHARLLSISGELIAAEKELAALLTTSESEPAVIVAQTWVLNRLGRFSEARELLKSIESRPDRASKAAYALALAELGETRAALETLAPLLPPASATTDADLLITAARFALVAGQPTDAERWLIAARRADPSRDEIYAGLISLYGAGAALANEAKLLETVRAMRDADPQSPTLRLLRSQEAAARRQFEVAERELIALAEEYPDRVEPLRVLSQIWRASDGLERGERWLRTQIERRPGLATLTIVLADTLWALDRKRETVTLLEDWLSRAPGDNDASRALEGFLRQVPGEEARADAITELRLSRAPASIDTYLEQVEWSVRKADPKRAAEWAERLAALNQAPSPVQELRAERVAQAVATFAMDGKLDGDPALVLFNALLKIVSEPDPVSLRHRARLLVLTVADVNQIIAATDAAAAASPADRDPTYSLIARDLFENGALETGRKARPRDGVKLLEHACNATQTPSVRLLAEWTIRVAPLFVQFADPALNPLSREEQNAAVQRVFQLSESAGVTRALISELAQSLIRNDRSTIPPADTAQVMSGQLDNAGDSVLAERLLRVALDFDPDHVWANNNLGYRLLNEGRDIDEAHALIERSYNTMKKDPTISDRSSVIDSLGWARYKLGIIHDQPASDTRPAREGAVSLLTRSLDLAKRERNQELSVPIISDHLGDAMWAAGNREWAIIHWTEAAKRANEVLSDPRMSDLESAAQREVADTARNAQAKSLAAQEDRVPEISPMLRPVNAPPPAFTPAQAPAMID